jgi:hypothetical protein
LSRLCLGVLRTATGELLSTDDIAGRVIAAKGFDAGDGILRVAVREQVGTIVKRRHCRELRHRPYAQMEAGRRLAGQAFPWYVAGGSWIALRHFHISAQRFMGVGATS